MADYEVTIKTEDIEETFTIRAAESTAVAEVRATTFFEEQYGEAATYHEFSTKVVEVEPHVLSPEAEALREHDRRMREEA